jgi:hypothetical protein
VWISFIPSLLGELVAEQNKEAVCGAIDAQYRELKSS